MKRYTVILTLAIAAVLSGACIEVVNPSDEMVPGIGLIFDCGSFPETKAKIDSAGVTSLNENVLHSVEYFIYPDNGTGSDAVLHGYLSNVTASTKVYSVPVTDDIVNTVLCPGSSKYFKVYAIANLGHRIIPQAATEDLSHTSVAELEVLTRELDTDATSGDILTTQNDFFMATNGAFRVGPVEKRATNVVTARVPLERVAAKITILVRLENEVTIPNTVVINGVSDVRNEVWRPRAGEMQIYLVNTALEGQASGEPLASSPILQYPTLEFDDTRTETHHYSTFTPVLDGEGNVTDYTETDHEGEFTPCEAPFYTNPVSWEYGSETEPYIKLMIPWDRDPGVSTGGVSYGTASKNYYYRIYCPGDPIDGTHAQFIRNNWYKIVLNVGVLGSDTDGGESIINGKYYVVDWQERDSGSGSGGSGSGINDSDKEAEIKGARYLFLNKTEYELFNINDLSIPYVTSDPCTIVSFTGTRHVFSGISSSDQTITDPSTWGITLNLSAEGGAHINFNHVLNNDLSTSNYDISEYIFTFRIRHLDAQGDQSSGGTYYQDITVKQYPAIMIKAQLNSAGNNSNSSGYVYIDTKNSTSTDAWRRNTTLGGGNNANPNMYIISTSVLSDQSRLIGDPRTTEAYSDSQLVSGWTSSAAVHVDGSTNHRLTYYYPSNSDEAYKNVIAPKFRVASSFGKSQNMSYNDAKRRCASYQEDGYPAGRWRIPTMAEVMYITTLSHDGKIPELFTFTASSALDESYWCASGKIDGVYGVPTYYSGTTGNRYIRCVYDEWYWENMTISVNNVERNVSTVDRSTFTWGDIQR